MSIYITKLHLILFFTAVMITMYFFVQNNQKYSFLSYFDRIRVDKPVTPQPVAPPSPPVDNETIRHNTRAIIAIAGEERKIAISKGQNVSKGQGILRQAKRLEQEGDYTQAVKNALAAIDEFKTSHVQTSRVQLLPAYTVKRGDNLWNISKRKDVYGRGSGWVKLWRANENKIPDFDEIYSGQVVNIPRN